MVEKAYETTLCDRYAEISVFGYSEILFKRDNFDSGVLLLVLGD